LLFLALLQNRAGVSIYYSLALFYNKGWTAYFTSGSFVWSLNLITLMYLAMFVLIAIESIRMSGWFAPVRILYYSLFCFMMALLTIAVLYSIVALAILYLVITFVSYLLFKSRKRKRTEENEIGFFKESFSNFRTELIEWEKNRKNQPKTSRVKPKRKPFIRRKKRVTNSINEAETADDIPRLYPDD
jgi:Ca2+/Na+ antiporter